MQSNCQYVEFAEEEISSLAIAYGSIKQVHRESRHSFTGFVIECHFDDGAAAVAFSKEISIHVGIFTAIRVISEDSCYVSVPCKDVDF